jgi:rRNA maturation endonuclease Nob1
VVKVKGTKRRRIVDSKGLRGSKLLTNLEKKEIFDYAKKYYTKDADELIQFADDFSTNNTGYMAIFDVLYINTDIMPGVFKSANSRLSWKSAVAHELEGHRAAALAERTFFDSDLSVQACDLLEEMQASIRASKHGKKLSQLERKDLLDDAIERFENHKDFLKGSKYENYTFNQIKEILWISKS